MSHQKMDQLVGFLLHPPPYEIAKKLGKMLRYTPHFQRAFGTAAQKYKRSKTLLVRFMS